MNEKQFQQVNRNISTSAPKNQSSALQPATKAKKPPVKLCECGGERIAVYVSIFGYWLHAKHCTACEAKEKLAVIRRVRKEKAFWLRKRIINTVPDLFHGAHVGHIAPEVLSLLKTKGLVQGIYFWGDVGRGKTYTAAAIMRYCIVRGKTVKRAAIKDIVDEIQATFHSHKSAEMVYQRYIMADLLCIEDIGTAKSAGVESDFNQDVLLKLIDRRQEAKKPTMITSNLSPERICDSYGTRIYSRLQKFLIIKMTGKDRRGQLNG